jgi:CRP-like cAMP-binding protein
MALFSNLKEYSMDSHAVKKTTQYDTVSCLVERLRYYIEISDENEQLLRELEKNEVSYKSRVKLHLQEQRSNLYILKSGWLYRYVDLPDDRRQVLRVHYPGDIVGLTDVAMEETLGDTLTATDVVLCPFPKKSLDTIFIESPRLTALIFSLGMLEEAILLDRITMIGRSSAINRVANYMLEIHSRQRTHTNNATFNIFDMPLTQEVIADALGLTNVTVSNAFTQLEQEGKIIRDRKKMTILEPDKLKKELDFKDRYFRIDTSWFPNA